MFKKRKSSDDLLFNIQKVYGPYIVNCSKKVDFLINIFQRNDYSFLEKNKNHYLFIFEREKKKINVANYVSIRQLNYIIIQILIELLAKNGFFFHGSVVVNKKNEAFIFTGTSGSGKTTISELVSKNFIKIADDSFFIKAEDNDYFVYTNPDDFSNKAEYDSKLYSIINKKFSIKGIFFLKKASYNKISKINLSINLVKKILRQVAINENYKKLHFSFLIRFIKKNLKKIYYLYFLNNDTIIKFIEKINQQDFESQPLGTVHFQQESGVYIH